MFRYIAPLLFAATLLHADKAPNFILIYADDIGYTQTSVPMMMERPETGHALHQTPNLEKLAAQGMRFSNAYAPSPVCTSSRASIQHGKTTARVGCVSLHDVVDDMGETKDLSQAMPEKTAEMIRKLDAYLEKVGAWTMEEVYATRVEELETWIERGQIEIAKINQQLEASNLSPAERKQLQAQLKSKQASFERHSTTLEKQSSIQSSGRWM
jgi:hypothetical protein